MPRDDAIRRRRSPPRQRLRWCAGALRDENRAGVDRGHGHSVIGDHGRGYASLQIRGSVTIVIRQLIRRAKSSNCLLFTLGLGENSWLKNKN